MWAFIIPILVQLLVAFITELLKRLNPPAMRGEPRLPDFAAARQDYISRLKWRFWYGPKRFQYAGAIFDKMQNQFAVSMGDGQLDIKSTVMYATAGLSGLKPSDLGDR